MKFVSLAAILAAGMVFVQNVQSATATTTWKLATGYSADSFHGKNLADFARKVDADTAGKLKIELHPNNALVKLNDITKAVQEGKIEAGETIMSSMVKDVPSAAPTLFLLW